MSQDKVRVLMKAFIEFQFGYCPLIWMFHSRRLNNKIYKRHERALRLVYKNKTLCFVELLIMDNSFTVRHRNLQKHAIDCTYLKTNPPCFMTSIFPVSHNHYNSRSESVFKSVNISSLLISEQFIV